MAQLGWYDIAPSFESEQAFHTNDRACFVSDVTTTVFIGYDKA
jgi:hypothetical protein